MDSAHVYAFSQFKDGNFDAARAFVFYMAENRKRIFSRGLTHRINRLNYEGVIIATADSIKDGATRTFFIALVKNRFDICAAILSKNIVIR